MFVSSLSIPASLVIKCGKTFPNRSIGVQSPSSEWFAYLYYKVKNEKSQCYEL